ncbi:DUF1189 domain-containing protein [Jeotgalibacillus marinus]|uniref:DUF1189 domain-containing protein n=1 Tax=Jeotgalibacillus marinus TaxID=86667 RepID=A0ABV3PZC2_9BACL
MDVFKQLWKSLYSPKDIARFRFQGIGKTILFLFILILLSLIPTAIKVTQIGNSIFTQGQEIIQSKLPTFEVQDGALISSSNEPVKVNHSDFTVIVDDSGELQPENFRNQFNTVALLQNEVVVAGQQYPYSMFSSATFNSDDISSLLASLNGAKVIIFTLIFFVMYVFSSALMFLKVAIFAAIGLLFANLLEKKLTYRHSFRIAAYSVVLSTVFFMIVGIIGSTIPAANFVNWLVTSIMLHLAIKEIPSRKPRTNAS